MSARPATSPPAHPAPRPLVWAVFGLLVLGSLALWIGVPVAGMWLASRLTDDFGWHMPLSLALVIPGMFVTAMGLAWLNGLYLRMTRGEFTDMHGIRYRNRGPLEPLLIACFVLAIAALFVWFFGFAENPPRQVI